MLYQRWCALVTSHSDALAVRDAATGRTWTFAQLHHAAEINIVTNSEIIYPRNSFPEFLIDILSAWRLGKVVCPLEPGQVSQQVSPPPKNCVHLKLTSATTAASRMVAFTAAQLQADVVNIVATMGLRAEWPNLGVISMAHSYGFSNLTLPLLLHGIPLIHLAAPLPEMLRRAAENEIALTLAGAPALWRAWHEAKAIPQNVQLAISAGAPLPVSLEREIFETTGLKVHNFYGATECGGIAFDVSNTPRADDSCVGEPLKNVSVTVNESGCLMVRSAAVGETFWPERADALAAGKLETSDLAEIKNGAVYLRGRLSDQINIAGRKVSPETIERALRTHDGVRDCLVFGVPSDDAERTEIIVAVMVSSVNELEIRHHLQTILQPWQLPRGWWFVDSLAANERGKISRAEWRRRYLARGR